MSSPYVGQIMIFGGNFAPAGWAQCNGQLLPISEYETLFNLIGTTYGGDGQSTFAVPDLRGRVPVHMGQGPSITQNYTIGKEQSGRNADAIRHLVDSIATVDVTPKMSLMANYDYGMDRFNGNRVRWQGIALYGRITPAPKFRISPRFEWYDDPQGFKLGRAQTLKEGTLTTDLVMNENMVLRGEYRYDWSDRAVFERNNRRPISHQSTLTVGVVFSYTRGR